MANRNFVSQDVADFVAKFINKKHFNLLNQKFTIEEVQEYCEKQMTKHFENLTKDGMECIKDTIEECLKSLVITGVVKQKGNKYKAVGCLMGEAEIYSFSSRVNTGDDIQVKNYYKIWKEGQKEQAKGNEL